MILSIVILHFFGLTTLVSAQSQNMPKVGDQLTVKTNVTLFSLAGYDLKTYDLAAKEFATFREYGITDMIPRKIAWPVKSDTVEYKGYERLNGEDYYEVKYQSLNGERTGFAKASNFSVEVRASPSRPSIQHNNRETSVPAPTCDNCQRHNLSSVCQSTNFFDLSKDIESYGSDYKNSEDLATYFHNFRKACKDRFQDSYLSEYQHYIREAAKSFQVPEALLACLLFKENQWDQATSSSGALGIAQFMPDTIKYTSAIIQEADMPKARIVELQAFKNEYLNAIKENLDRKVSGQKVKVVPSQWRKNYEYANAKLQNNQLATNWVDYIDNLRVLPSFKKNYPKEPWQGKYPTFFNSDRAKTPPLAIGMSALYLKKLINNFAESLDDNVLQGKGQLLPFLTAVAGAYNMGPGNAIQAIGNPPPKSASKWVEKLRTNPETTKHMESIKRCMENKNLAPPLAIGRGGKLVEQTACPN